MSANQDPIVTRDAMTREPTTQRHPRLTQVWKGSYPFRLACPSFVYAADYDTNVDRLGPHVDEIELLVFESAADSLPTPEMIARLQALGRRHTVGYNIHLPTDVTLAADDADARRTAAERIHRVCRRVAPLAPAFHVLHLEYPPEKTLTSGDRGRWEARVNQGLERLARRGVDLHTLRIENQRIPLDWLAAAAEAHDLGLCLDIGHLLLAGTSLEGALMRHHARIRALHVHGVDRGRDHRPLTCLTPHDQDVLKTYLHAFRGSVSVEVFDFDGLRASLRLIAEWLG